MAGYSATATDVNMKAGSLVTSLWDDLDAIRRFKLWLDDHADAVLQAAPYSMVSGDITVIKNSFADLGGTSGLWAVSHGSFTPTGANNYFFNAKGLTGVNYTG